MERFTRILARTQAVLGHDFCPSANRWVYWMKHPLACIGAAAVVALVCGIWVNAVAFLVLAAMAMVALLGIAWPWVSATGLKCRIEFPVSRMRAGHAVPVRIFVQNRFPWPAWGLTFHWGLTPAGRQPAELALARVAGWSQTEFEWTFRPPMRGVFPTTLPRLQTAFPFGIVEAGATTEVLGQLIVWPASEVLDALPDAAETDTSDERTSDRRVGDCGDIIGTRPFRSGDPLRRVHWRQTARHGRLIATERQAPAVCAMRVLIDVAAESHGPAGGTLEATISAAASVVESLHRQHASLECELGGARFTVGASASGLNQFLDALARVPHGGVGASCEERCPSRQRYGDRPSLCVTTESAFRRHLANRHRHESERYLVVRNGANDAPSGSGDRPDGCDCHPWLAIRCDRPLRDELPPRWRRACRAH